MRIAGADIKDSPAVVRQREMEVRMCKCSPHYLIRDVVHLGGIGLEELQACGDIVKEVVD